VGIRWAKRRGDSFRRKEKEGTREWLKGSGTVVSYFPGRGIEAAYEL